MSNCENGIVKIEGVVEAVLNEGVRGWATDGSVGVVIEVFVGDQLIGADVAHAPRSDLAQRVPPCSGFFVATSTPVTAHQLLTGEATVVARNGEIGFKLPLWEPVRQAALFETLDFEALNAGWNLVNPEIRKRAALHLNAFSNRIGFGRMSADSDVQVGRNGHLFLAGGSNQLTKLYAGEMEIDVDGWLTCFEQRGRRIEELGARYVQMVIPEKSSVLHELAPYPATRGSRHYLNLFELCRERGLPVLDGLQALTEHDAVGSASFSMGDSHLSTKGAESIVRAFLEMIGEPIELDQPAVHHALTAGDLGTRFAADGDVREHVMRYDDLAVGGSALKPVETYAFDPPTGHIGITRVWQSENAPIRKKVICFGNSFFERGGASTTLAWWFARLFKEFHLVWAPACDLEYVEREKPDIVVCQTIERFLTRVPAT